MGQTFSAKANPGSQRNEQVDTKDKGIDKDVILTRNQVIEEANNNFLILTRKQGVEVEDSNAKDEEKHVLSQGKGMYSAHFQRNEQIQEVGPKDNEKHVLSSPLGMYSARFQRNEQIQEVGRKDNEKHVLFKHIPPLQRNELIPEIDCSKDEEQEPEKYINKLEETPTGKQNVVEDYRRKDDSIDNVEIPTNKEVFEINRKEVAMNNESLSMNMWLKQYNNCQRILLVGDGDFSFSASLVVAFGSSGSNITATSNGSADFLRRAYTKTIANIENLTSCGATIMLRLNAATMANHPYLRLMKFDRIIYNVPYFGLSTRDRPNFLKRQQKKLVKGFLSNAKKMVKEDGEIHISHQTNGFHLDWDIVNELALLEGLCLDRQVNFNLSDYPGFEETKYGDGNEIDSGQCKTYMWRIVSIGLLH